MKDSDARGLVLRRLYDLRDQKEHAQLADFSDFDLELKTLGRLLEQLAEKSLIKWKPVRNNMG